MVNVDNCDNAQVVRGSLEDILTLTVPKSRYGWGIKFLDFRSGGAPDFHCTLLFLAYTFSSSFQNCPDLEEF